MTAIIMIDYKNIFFQVLELTRIHREPKYPKLQLLLNLIKENALSVHCDLGGWIHNHIGLVLIPEYYKEVSTGTPYYRPLITAKLRIPNNTAIHKNKLLQSKYKYERQLCRETVSIEKALTNKIVAAIEKKIPPSDRHLITKSTTKNVL